VYKAYAQKSTEARPRFLYEAAASAKGNIMSPPVHTTNLADESPSCLYSSHIEEEEKLKISIYQPSMRQ